MKESEKFPEKDFALLAFENIIVLRIYLTSSNLHI